MGIKIKLNRFEPEIKAIEAYPVTEGRVILYGSSMFRRWGYEKAAKDLSVPGAYDVLNHGFGGSTAEEQLYYYRRLIAPYKPSGAVIRTGSNDLYYGYSPEEAVDMAVRVMEWMKADNPDIKILFLPIFDCPSHIPRNCIEPSWEYNRLAREYIESSTNITYFDILPWFYNSPSDVGTLKNFRDIFLPDGIHLTTEGYGEYAPYLSSAIQKLMLG